MFITDNKYYEKTKAIDVYVHLSIPFYFFVCVCVCLCTRQGENNLLHNILERRCVLKSFWKTMEPLCTHTYFIVESVHSGFKS